MHFKKILQNTLVHLVFLFVIALLLRLYRFRAEGVFLTSDEVYLFQYSLKPVMTVFNADTLRFVGEQLFRYFNFNWGWGFISISTINVFILTLFGIPLTEYNIILPYALLGSLTTPLIYLLGKKLSDKTTGFIAGLITAFIPSHVSFSRSIGLHGIATAFFFMLTIFLFLNYFIKPSNRKKWIAYSSLGFYFAVDFQFYVILPVILLAGILYSKKNAQTMIRDLVITKHICAFFVINIPIFASATYLTSKGLLYNAYLAHPFTKQSYFGFFLTDVLTKFHFHIGTGFFMIGILAILWGIITLFTTHGKKKLFTLGWFFITISPFVIFINPTYTQTSVYLLHALFALTLLSAIFTGALIAHITRINSLLLRKCAIILFATSAIIIITTTISFIGQSVFGTNCYKYRAPYDFGAVQQNTGMKTAGYFVRENILTNDTVFLDAETFLGNHYFGREVLGGLDLTNKEILQKYRHFRNVGIIPDWIILETKHLDIFKEELKNENYNNCISITHKQKVIRTIFKKGWCNKTTLKTEDVDALFDKKYGDVKSLFFNYE